MTPLGFCVSSLSDHILGDTRAVYVLLPTDVGYDFFLGPQSIFASGFYVLVYCTVKSV